MRISRMILLAAVALPAAAISARPLVYTLPIETIPAELAQDDAAVVVQNCSACHSLDYIAKQPRHKGAQFWRDAVTKMVNVYKAPLAPADGEAVAAVLVQKFG